VPKRRGKVKVRELDVKSRWVTLTQAVEYAALSKSTLRRLIRAGRLAAYRPGLGGSSILIEKAELDRLILQSRSGSGKTHYKKPAEPAAC